MHTVRAPVWGKAGEGGGGGGWGGGGDGYVNEWELK